MTTTTASAPLLLVALVLASVLFLSATAARRPPVSTCTEELVLISPCLPYISAPPNKLSEAPSEKCCDALSLTMNSSRSGVCLCYLVLEPMILGFPVNGARVLSLCRVCMRLRDGSSSRSISLASLCSGFSAAGFLDSTLLAMEVFSYIFHGLQEFLCCVLIKTIQVMD